MKHAILILAHKNPKQICHLIATFQGRHSIFVHIDKKNCFTIEELKEISQQVGVIGMYCKYTVHWSGFNMLKCELYLLREALQNCDADYFHLISGQDYPIKPLAEFEARFERNKGKEFISYKELPAPDWEGNTYRRFRYFLFNDLFDAHTSKGAKFIDKIVEWQKCIGLKRNIPDQLDHLYGGSQWFSITRECASYLLEYTHKHPAFYRRLKYTFAPEETYISTVIMNSTFSHRVINDNCRFIRWKYENGNSPANLSEMHFFYLVTSTALFARKFEYPLCERLAQLVDDYLLRDEEVRVSTTGYWLHDTLSNA